jgi:hypothetical protein
MIDPTDLRSEREIRWMENPEKFEYVRERLAVAGTRSGPVPWSSRSQGAGRKVGEAVLSPDASSFAPGKFERRVFVVCDRDRSKARRGEYDPGTAPMEGVDPQTVEPGRPGEQTRRAWGEQTQGTPA